MTAEARPRTIHETAGTARAGPARESRRWSRRRSGPHAGDYQLGVRNIYVLPSRAGVAYLAITAAMLLTSVNYDLALGYALTFLLGAIGLVGILHTYRNLSALVFRPGRADAVFAGQLADVDVMVSNRSNLERFAVQVSVPGATRPEIADIAPASEQMLRLSLPTSRRGRVPVPRLRIGTRYPLGIFDAWTWWQPAQDVVVYPAPEPPPCPLPTTAIASGNGSGRVGHDDDISAIRPWRSGDSPHRIAWSAMARTDSEELLTKEFEGGSAGELVLEWSSLPASMSVEDRLSRLTRWVVDADASGTRFSLRIPGRSIDVDAGPGHRDACLTALALHEGAPTGEAPAAPGAERRDPAIQVD